MIHKFVIELLDSGKGYESEVESLERLYGAEEINDSDIYNQAIDDFVEECLKHKSKDEYEYQIMCFDEFTMRRLSEKVKKAGGKNDNTKP